MKQLLGCVIEFSQCATGEPVRVDIGGSYSVPDYQHFLAVLAEMAHSSGPGQSFKGDQPGCRSLARQRVSSWLSDLNDNFVWKSIETLAAAILEAVPVAVRLIGRSEIERAAGFLSGYKPASSGYPPQAW
jgi:hypothetical protein